MTTERSSRRYDIDWLRNIGILLLFPFHSARVFDHWEAFYIKSDVLSWVMSWFVALTDFWFMPLLFWLAGSSSWYALQFRSFGEYTRDRFLRLFIPFVVGLLLVVPPQGFYAMKSLGQEMSYLQYLPSFFTDFSDLSGYTGAFSPTHLWFILYLFVLSLVAIPIMRSIKNRKADGRIERLTQILCHPFSFILLSVPLTLTLALPAPGGKNPVYYLFIFLLGFLVTTDWRFQDMFNRFKLPAFILSILFTTVWISLGSTAGESFYLSALVDWLRNVDLLLVMMAILGYGNQYLNRGNKWLTYFNEAAFPVYILHQTVLVVVGYYILKLPAGIYPQFLLIMTGTCIVSLGIYEWIIKRNALTRAMFGVKIREKNRPLQPKGTKVM